VSSSTVVVVEEAERNESKKTSQSLFVDGWSVTTTWLRVVTIPFVHVPHPLAALLDPSFESIRTAGEGKKQQLLKTDKNSGHSQCTVLQNQVDQHPWKRMVRMTDSTRLNSSSSTSSSSSSSSCK